MSTDRPRERARADRSSAAMRAATTELMRRHGASGVTHLTVAAKAGVGRATVYRTIRWWST